MATIDKRIGGLIGGGPVKGAVMYWLQGTIDFSEDNQTSGQLVHLINVSKGHVIHEVMVDIETIEDSTLTYDVGVFESDGTTEVDADGFMNGTNGETLGMLSSRDGSAAYSNESVYCSAQRIITLTPQDNADAAKITVYALVSMMIPQNV